jgi:hypothetical protein
MWRTRGIHYALGWCVGVLARYSKVNYDLRDELAALEQKHQDRDSL